jgi:hypothetical protein
MADAPKDCIAQRDDYLECLHHTKEVSNRAMCCTWLGGGEWRTSRRQSIQFSKSNNLDNSLQIVLKTCNGTADFYCTIFEVLLYNH